MRVAQEALTNVRKHACAKQVWVSAESADGGVRLRIEDDRRGFDVAALAREAETHFGQRIMRERMADVGGTVTVDSAPGKGTRVIITAPLRAKA
jgi:signal transduction histidine kinase